MENESGIPGINWEKDRGTWRVYVRRNNKKIYLGRRANATAPVAGTSILQACGQEFRAPAVKPLKSGWYDGQK